MLPIQRSTPAEGSVGGVGGRIHDYLKAAGHGERCATNQDKAHLEDDDALSAGYRAEAAVIAQMLRDLGLRFWWRDGSGFCRAMALSPVAEPKPTR
jgi:hypothetical protein